MSINVAFVLDSGIAHQAVILANSIDFYLKKVSKVFIGIPKSKLEDSSVRAAKKIIDKLRISEHVEYITIENQFEEYLIGNKIELVAALDCESVYFLDTDMIFTAETILPKIKPNTLLARPADFRTWGKHENWQTAYGEAGVEFSNVEKCKTTIDELDGELYLNAGFIGVYSPALFGRRWRDIALTLDRSHAIKNKRPWLDQIALPITVQSLAYRFDPANNSLNFPGHMYTVSRNISLVHYHALDYLYSDVALSECLKSFDLNLQKIMKAFQVEFKYPVVVRLLDRLIPGCFRLASRITSKLKY